MRQLTIRGVEGAYDAKINKYIDKEINVKFFTYVAQLYIEATSNLNHTGYCCEKKTLR